jgi:Nuclease-related domain
VDEDLGKFSHTYARLTLPGDTATRRPGQSAREKALELRPRGLKSWTNLLTGTKGSDYSWARGAKGEELVGRLLARLDSGWAVVHDLQIGNRGSNIDHLVVGPGGAFSLNTKHLKGEVRATARTFRVNGYRKNYFPKVVGEARAVEDRLKDSLPDGARVKPMLVVIAPKVDVRVSPPDVAIVTPDQLLPWLNDQPPTLSSDEVKRVEKTMRLPTTWGKTPDRAELVLKPWRRYGHNRIYVNERDGAMVAMYDRKTKTLEIGDKAKETAVRQALAGYLGSDE